ncbi:MAG: hypothetical protein AAGA32_02060 [Pseudomonadota bacterium]
MEERTLEELERIRHLYAPGAEPVWYEVIVTDHNFQGLMVIVLVSFLVIPLLGMAARASLASRRDDADEETPLESDAAKRSHHLRDLRRQRQGLDDA